MTAIDARVVGPAVARPTFRSALRAREFRWLMVAYSLQAIGQTFGTVAITVAIFEQTGSATWVAFAAAARLVPYVLLSGLAGVLADRIPRKTLLALSVSARAALATLLSGRAPRNRASAPHRGARLLLHRVRHPVLPVPRRRDPRCRSRAGARSRERDPHGPRDARVHRRTCRRSRSTRPRIAGDRDVRQRRHLRRRARTDRQAPGSRGVREHRRRRRTTGPRSPPASARSPRRARSPRHSCSSSP